MERKQGAFLRFSYLKNRVTKYLSTPSVKLHHVLEHLEPRILLDGDPLANTLARFSGKIDNPNEQQSIEINLTPEEFTPTRIDATGMGFYLKAQDGSTLDPAVVEVYDKDGNLMSPRVFTPDLPNSHNSLMVTELPYGEYEIKIGGDNSTTGQYHLDVFLVGDADGDRDVDRDDTTAIYNAYGSQKGGNLYIPEADVNQDGLITSFDVAHHIRNIGSSTVISPASLFLNAQLHPEPTLITPDGLPLTSNSSVSIHCTTTPWANVELDYDNDGSIDITALVGSSGQFNFPVTLTEGLNVLKLRAYDNFGQEQFWETSVVLQTNSITLVEQTHYEVLHEHAFVIPDEPSHIQFQYDVSFDTNDAFVNDAFEVALLDTTGQSLVHTIATDRDVAFNQTEGEFARYGINTQVDGETVKIDLTHIPAGMDAKLVFRLVNNDRDTQTSVTIEDLRVLTGSLGTPVGSVSGMIVPNDTGNPLAHGPLEDVSQAIQVDYHTTSLYHEESMLFVDIGIQNMADYVVDGPLLAFVTNLSDPSVTLKNADGFAPTGEAYLDLTPYLVDGSLEAGATIPQTITLAFHNPDHIQFDYNLVFLGQLNEAPVFISEPITNAPIDLPYTYQAQAQDPDGDSITYSLLVAPEGMSIDSVTGQITWNPDYVNIGIHTLLVVAEDGRGGYTEQRFDLTVKQAPPNRPPVITSTPIIQTSLTQESRDITGDPVQANLENWESIVLRNCAYGQDGWGSPMHQNPDWKVEGDQVTQLHNADASMFISDFEMFNERIEGTWQIVTPDPDNDNDWMGFVFGYQNPQHFYLFDWRGGAQSWFGASSHAGMAVKVVDSPSELTSYDMANTTGSPGKVTTLYTNDIPWEKDKEYRFILEHNPGVFTITIKDGDTVLMHETFEDITYPTGKFGFYNYSQGNVLYKGFITQQVENPSYYYDVEATDPDLDNLTYALVEAPEGMKIHPNTGEIAWLPSVEQLGEHTVTVEVSDPYGGKDLQTFIVRVLEDPDNHAPTFVTTPVAQVTEGETYQYDAGAVDFDGDNLEYSIISGPEGMTIDAQTGNMSWETDATSVGHHAIVIRVEDGHGGRAEQNYLLAVHEPGTGIIRGIKFNDLDASGTQSTLIQYEDGDFEQSEWEYRYVQVDGTGSTGSIVRIESDGNPGAYNQHTHRIHLNNRDLIYTVALSSNTYHPSIQGGIKSFSMTIDVLENPNNNGWTAGHLMLEQNGILYYSKVLRLDVNSWHTYTLADIKAEDFYSTPPSIGQMVGSGDHPDFSADGSPMKLGYALANGGSGWGSYGTSVHRVDNWSAVVTPEVEPGLPAWKIYLDHNDNHQHDQHEPYSYTDENGAYEFTDLPAGTYTIREEMQNGWQQTTPANGANQVTLTDGQVVEGVNFGNMAVSPSENSPVIFSQPITTATANQMYRYVVDALDPEDEPMTYHLAIAPDGMTMHPQLGIIAWMPTIDQLGENHVVLKVSDSNGDIALQSFLVDVRLPNTAPVITTESLPNPIQAGLPFERLITAQDAEDQAITFDLAAGAPSGLTIDADSGLLTWLPSAAQIASHVFTVVVTDSEGLSSSKTFNVDVVVDIPNDPPVIQSHPRLLTRIDLPYLYLIEATDTNGDPLEYTLQGDVPSGMTLKTDYNTPRIEWYPVAADLGSHALEILVTDGRGGEAVQVFTLEVVTSSQNSAPVIQSTPSLHALAGKTYVYRAEATDAEGDAMLWTLEEAPQGVSLHAVTGELYWTPTADHVDQNHSFILWVTDAYGASTRQAFTVNVQLHNRPPSILSSAQTEGSVGKAYVYNVQATDPDGHPVTFSLSEAPTGMTIDSQTGRITWTPAADQTGNQDVTVQVQDGFGGVDGQLFTIEVTDENRNAPPIITSTPGFHASADLDYAYQVYAEDPEIEPLLFSLDATGHPQGMTIEPETGLIRWTPTLAQIGNHSVVIVVTDLAGNQATQSFFLTVHDNHAPVIVSQPVVTVMAGEEYNYDVHVTDPDGDVIDYQLVQSPNGMIIDPHGRIRWLTTQDEEGQTFTVRVRVTDVCGATAEQSYQLHVSEDTQAPLVELGSQDNLLDPGDSTTFYARATDNLGISDVVLLINGVEHAMNVEGALYRTDLTFDNPGLYDAVARATDLSGNQGFSEPWQIRVFDPNDSGHPEVTIHSPEYQDMITYLTDVVISVEDDNLDYWKIEYAPANLVDAAHYDANDPDWILLAHGNETLDQEVAAVFDPTVLANDAYIMRVSAYDVNGSGWSEPLAFGVSGNAKLGNFSLSFTDLSIPLAGIPIEITRTYDTLQSNRQGDFGYGWSLAYADANIAETTPEGYEMQPGDRVFLTTPDGRRVGFTYDPIIDHSAAMFIGHVGSTYTPNFTPDPGVYETLSVKEGAYMRHGVFGDIIQAFSGAWNPSQYVLTMTDGTTYEYNQGQGLQQVTDNNGNIMGFSVDGITHSSGQNIQFRRDPQGRIVEIEDPNGHVLMYDYDAYGNLISFTDQEGYTTTFSYLDDPAHYLDEIVDPLGNRAVKTEYDEDGRVKAVIDAEGNRQEQSFDPGAFTGTYTDGNGNVTTYHYNDRGNVIYEIDPLLGVTCYLYEDPNNPDKETSTTDPNGHTTNYTYDSRGNKLTETDALGNTTTYTYDSNDNLTSITDPLGQTTAYTYDNKGKLTSMTNAAGNSMTMVYDNQGRVVSTTDYRGNTTRFEYDGNSQNPNRVINPDDTVKQFEYNIYGQVTRQTNEVNHDTWFEYDSLGRLKVQRDNAGNETKRDYDAAGNLTKITDPLGNVTLYEYDKANKLIKETNAEGGVVTYTYDKQGNRLTLTDPVGNTTTWVYDENNRMIEEIDPLNNSRLFDYDPAGNLIEKIDRLDRKTEFIYDALNRLITENWYSNTGDLVNTITSTYDAFGNLLTIDDAYSAYAYTYDSLNRIISEDNAGSPDMPHVILYHEYDANGNDIHTWDNTGVEVASVYDSRNRLISRTWQGPDMDEARIDFQHCWCDVLVGIKRYSDLEGNNLVATTRYKFDETGRYTEITHKDASDNILAQYLYDYDAAGRLIWDSIDGATATYTYDKTGQLLTVDREGSSLPDEYYIYDANGNRIESHLHGDAYQTGEGNRLLTDGDFNYEYDAEGNVIRKIEIATGNVTEYTYDHRNRLIKVTETSPGGIILNESEYILDSLDRRIAITIGGQKLAIVYNNVNAWGDYNVNGDVETRYLFGPKIDEIYARYDNKNDVVWYVLDKQGSVRKIVNNQGSVIADTVYDSFGGLSEELPTSYGRYTFTSREFETGSRFYYYRARYYNPALGRFIQYDPLSFDSGQFNLYAYVGNSSVNSEDPTGLSVYIEEISLTTYVGVGIVVAEASAFGCYDINGNLLDPETWPPASEIAFAAIGGALSGVIAAFTLPLLPAFMAYGLLWGGVYCYFDVHPAIPTP